MFSITSTFMKEMTSSGSPFEPMVCLFILVFVLGVAVYGLIAAKNEL